MTAERMKDFGIPTEPPSAVRAKRGDLAAWASTAKRKTTKPTGIPKASFERALVKIEEAMTSGDFAGTKPLGIFALFCKLHDHVYGMKVSWVGPDECKRACFQIASFLRAQFDGDVEALVDFVRWVWKREASRENWRRTSGRSGSRLQVRWVFTAACADDYRLDLARAHVK